MLNLKAKIRDVDENLEEMRKIGELPAVFYGSNKKTTSISISKIDFKKVINFFIQPKKKRWWDFFIVESQARLLFSG